MARSAKINGVGVGRLLVAAAEQEVRYTYSLIYEKDGRQGAKGAIEGSADFMRDAFRRGHCRLVLSDERLWPIHVVAHSDGGATAYFVVDDLKGASLS